MSEETPEARRLDRRGFLGAAAGVAAAGASATAWGTFANKASAHTSDTCTEVAGAVPKARRGCIHFTTPAQAWNTTALFQDFITFAKGLNCNAWEFAGSYPTVAAGGVTGNTGTLTPQGLTGWIALGSYAKTYGFRVVGTHDGPAPTSAANLGSAVVKMNAWGCNQLGAGSGYPSGAVNLPGAGTAITNPSAITAWQASAATMNTWGQAYQTGTGPVLGSTPYGAGVFGGTALTAGRTCARYYRHFHSEQGKWVQATGTKYDGHYISELIYTETDPNVAYAQSDQCWLLDGLWMSGGTAPSVGIQGAGEPNPGQGRNRLVQPDLVERWQDRIFAFHIKDLGTGTATINDQGTSVMNVGDNGGPGNATGNYPVDTIPSNGWSVANPYGAVPWATDGSQDTVQFQKIYERFRHPECHEYLFERDGMSNTVTSNAYWRKLYVQAFDMMDKLVFDRSPATLRTPFNFATSTDPASVWQNAYNSWLPYNAATGSARPAVGNGAPGATTCPPTIGPTNPGGPVKAGKEVRVTDRGIWTRAEQDDDFCYQWLRDGAPHPSYGGAPIGSKPECSCCGIGGRNYTLTVADAGHKISCQVTRINDEASHSNWVTNSLQVLGCRTDAQTVADIDALIAAVGSSPTYSSLSAGVKGTITGSGSGLGKARAQVMDATSPVATLNALLTWINSKTPAFISAGQNASLTASINAIKAGYANPC